MRLIVWINKFEQNKFYFIFILKYMVQNILYKLNICTNWDFKKKKKNSKVNVKGLVSLIFYITCALLYTVPKEIRDHYSVQPPHTMQTLCFHIFWAAEIFHVFRTTSETSTISARSRISGTYAQIVRNRTCEQLAHIVRMNFPPIFVVFWNDLFFF